jgi:ATP-dependent Lon protease
MARKRKTEILSSAVIDNELELSSPISSNLNAFIDEKIKILQKIMQNVVLSAQKHRAIDVFSNSDLNVCNNNLNELQQNIEKLNIKNTIENNNDALSDLQRCFDKISTIMSNFGTVEISDILYVVFGKDYTFNFPSIALTSKLELIKRHVSYIGYKIIPWKKGEPNRFPGICNDKTTDQTLIIEDYNTLECFEPVSLHRSFFYSTQGIRIVIQNASLQKTLILSGVSNNIEAEWLLKEPYIKTRKADIIRHIENYPADIDKYIISRLIDTFFLKDYLLYSESDVYKKYITLMVDVNYVKTNEITVIIKRFLEMDILHQRNFLMNILIYDKDYSVHYVAYMLYDLMTFPSTSSSEKIDSDQQTLMYNSFPCTVKSYFKDAMKNTIQHSNETINKYDSTRVTLEQQIVLLKVGDAIKDKAISKLKEIKGKPDDQSGKAKQYLEALLKIPFNIYKKEPILKKVGLLNGYFSELVKANEYGLEKKDKYTILEIYQNTNKMGEQITKDLIKSVKEGIHSATKSDSIHISNFIKKHIDSNFSVKSTMNRSDILSKINEFLFSTETPHIETVFQISKILNDSNKIAKSYDLTRTIGNEVKHTRDLIKDINESLDLSIYAHKNAKTQILKVISQWINGEQNGYCFGFEGSPGVGKTSLAKRGLAKCLKDENGETRPFSFIALGGSSNGSTLEGHSYTYVNSMWGKIVDTLMDSKCMNPIIYIDELDKVSKTEQGKEIIGILTHLIDYSQNDEFQDKYFSGIPIDLSKVLFIFSYNDPELIDRILLDRIHRIKFDNLSWDDKIVIANQFILPEINKKMGFCNTVSIDNAVIEYIIENYTLEPGIRKLKEILYDLHGEINIYLLQTEAQLIEFPIIVKIDDLGRKYLKTYKKIKEKHAHSEPKIGVINGLWASANGSGGIIPIECMFFPSTVFLDLKLTGMQGDVMKESMNVAKTLAWKLTPENVQADWIRRSEKTKNQGLHLHCPEGAVSKDGPSAGAAITSVIFSLLNDKKIKNDVAITGEITLQGTITAIGGLDLKIMGGIRAGIKKFIYPRSNQIEFDECELKYRYIFEKHGIKFVAVDSITDVFPHIF